MECGKLVKWFPGPGCWAMEMVSHWARRPSWEIVTRILSVKVCMVIVVGRVVRVIVVCLVGRG